MQPSIGKLILIATIGAVLAGATGCAGYQEGSASRTPGEVIDDVAIQSAVKTALLREPGVGRALVFLVLNAVVLAVKEPIRVGADHLAAVADVIETVALDDGSGANPFARPIVDSLAA